MIKIFGSKFCEQPIETHAVLVGRSIEENIKRFAPKADLDAPHFSVFIGGEKKDLDYIVSAGEEVEIVIEPRGIGAAIVTGVSLVVSAAALAYSYLTRSPAEKATSIYGGDPQEKSWARSKNPIAKIGGVTPDIAGSVRLTPNLISKERMFFDNSQMFKLTHRALYSIGIGDYDVSFVGSNFSVLSQTLRSPRETFIFENWETISRQTLNFLCDPAATETIGGEEYVHSDVFEFGRTFHAQMLAGGELSVITGNFTSKLSARIKFRRAGTEDAWETRFLTSDTYPHYSTGVRGITFPFLFSDTDLDHEFTVQFLYKKVGTFALRIEEAWLAVREQSVEPSHYSHSVLSLDLRAPYTQRDDEIEVEVSATRRLLWATDRDETGAQTGPLRATTHPIDYALYLLESHRLDAYIDYPSFQGLYKRPGGGGRLEAYSLAHSSESTLKSILDQCLAVMWCEVAVIDGKITLVQDGSYPSPRKVYTRDDLMSDPMVTVRAPSPFDPDTLVATYLDSGDWSEQTVQFGGMYGAKREMRITLPGVTNGQHAYYLARREFMRMLYERVSWEYTVTASGLGSRRLSLDLVAEEFFAKVLSSRVDFVEAGGDAEERTLVLSEDVGRVEAPAGLILQGLDGGAEAEQDAEVAGYRVTAEVKNTGAWRSLDRSEVGSRRVAIKKKDDHYAGWVVVKEIQPNADGTVTIRGVGYDHRVYGSSPCGVTGVNFAKTIFN